MNWSRLTSFTKIFLLVLLLLPGKACYAVSQTNLPFFVNPEVADKVNIFLMETKVFTSGCLAFLLVTSVLLFIYHLIRLGALSNHPMLRHKAIHDLMIVGGCTACLGSVSLLYTILVYFATT